MNRSALIAIALAGVVGAACGDDSNKNCGPGSASVEGLALSTSSATIMYGGLSASANGDCPVAGTPTGVDSVTIQTPNGVVDLLTVCIPRPDELGSGARTLGLDQVSGDVRIVDLDGSAGGCTYALDRTVAPTGTVTATGVCDDGTNAAGFALTFAGTVSITQTCGATMTTASAMLDGTVAVAGPVAGS